MKSQIKFFALSLFAGTVLNGVQAMANPVCVQQGGMTVCSDRGVTTVCAHSGGTTICQDSQGQRTVGVTRGDTSVITGPGGTSVCQDKGPASLCAGPGGVRVVPKPWEIGRDRGDHDRGRWGHDRDRGDHGRWGHDRDRWGHDRDRWGDRPTYPQPEPMPEPTPLPRPDYPSYPDREYPDTNTTPELPALCVGSFAGKFGSGAKVVVQATSSGAFYIKAQGSVYSASGTCELVGAKKAKFRIVFDDDASYVFAGTITRAKNGSRKMTAVQMKRGKTIDKLSLSSVR